MAVGYRDAIGPEFVETMAHRRSFQAASSYGGALWDATDFVPASVICRGRLDPAGSERSWPQASFKYPLRTDRRGGLPKLPFVALHHEQANHIGYAQAPLSVTVRGGGVFFSFLTQMKRNLNRISLPFQLRRPSCTMIGGDDNGRLSGECNAIIRPSHMCMPKCRTGSSASRVRHWHTSERLPFPLTSMSISGVSINFTVSGFSN